MKRSKDFTPIRNKFKVKISVNLDESQREQIRWFLNKTWFGKEKIPLEVKHDDLPKELHKAHWYINAGWPIKLEIEIDKFGRLKILKCEAS